MRSARNNGILVQPQYHPFSEHEKRRETVERYAQEIGLPLIVEPAYEMPTFFPDVVGMNAFANVVFCATSCVWSGLPRSPPYML